MAPWAIPDGPSIKHKQTPAALPFNPQLHSLQQCANPAQAAVQVDIAESQCLADETAHEHAMMF